MLAQDVTALDAAVFGIDVESMSMSADGRRCYLGAARVGHLRECLGVLDLDPAGAPVGTPRWYPVGTDALPTGATFSVLQILPNPQDSKLYLALDPPSAAQRQLAVVDLVNGEPTGQSRAYRSCNPLSFLYAMARHPTLRLLYAVGHGGQGVAVHRLRDDGEPDGEPEWVSLPQGGGKYDVAVSPDGAWLYLGAYHDALQVVPLDATGLPLSAQSKAFPGKGNPDNPNGSPGYLRLLLSPHAVYRRRPLGAKKPEWPLASWRLGSDGFPIGELREHGELTAATSLINHTGDRIVLLRSETTKDTFTKTPVISGSAVLEAPLGADGSPGASTIVVRLPRRTGLNSGQLAGSATGRVAVLTRDAGEGFLVNEVSGWHFRITPKKVRTTEGEVTQAVLYQGAQDTDNKYLLTATLGVDQPSPWTLRDPLLHNQFAGRLIEIHTIDSVVELTLQIDIADGNPAHGGKLMRSMTDTVAGHRIQFLVPGYDVQRSPERSSAVELLSEYTGRLAKAALAVALPEDRRPRQYPISCYGIQGGQGHRGQLDAELRTVRALGINTAGLSNWDAIPPAEIAEVAARHGLVWRSAGVYGPPSLFSFDTVQMNPEALKAWAEKLILNGTGPIGATAEQLIELQLADESAWYFPSKVEELKDKDNDKAGWLEAFRTYLKNQGLSPGDVGAADWSHVVPIAAAGVGADAASHRLFLATLRFLAESATEGLAMARAAVQTVLEKHGAPRGRDAFIFVNNNNNKPNHWYLSHPNKTLNDNNPYNGRVHDPAIGPSLATGGFDWLHSGRRSAFTQWSEDEVSDHDPQFCSYLGDLLRSAAALGTESWGCYLKGNALGTLPSGPSYKLLSMIGHGAGIVDLFTFGPSVIFGADGWSHLTQHYEPIARAIGLVGAAEGYLVGAKRAPGTVAVLTPGNSHPWDTEAGGGLYLPKVQYLHTTLVHRGYPVDFVDEHDLETGALDRYRALYLTGPNLSVRAQQAVATWVSNGGVLAVTPGAATADELNRPTAVLDPVLGLAERTGERFIKFDGLGSDELEFGNNLGLVGTDVAREKPTFLDGAYPFMPVLGPHTPLNPAGADTEVVAVFRSAGRFAVTARQHGQGIAIAIAYGFFPGTQYQRSADRSRITRLPAGWGETQREAVVAPARIANASRPVKLNITGVEACRLDRKAGGTPPSAIILLNWSGRPVDSLTVTVNGTPATHARSIQQGTLPVKAPPTSRMLTVSLPLTDVDVLLLD